MEKEDFSWEKWEQPSDQLEIMNDEVIPEPDEQRPKQKRSTNIKRRLT